jgi:hypothetical protein
LCCDREKVSEWVRKLASERRSLFGCYNPSFYFFFFSVDTDLSSCWRTLHSVAVCPLYLQITYHSLRNYKN